jgi:hypothetical protein
MSEKRPWGKFRSVDDRQMLFAQPAEIFFARDSMIPLFVLWVSPPPGSARPPEGETWHMRGITDNFSHDLPAGWTRLHAVSYVEELIGNILSGTSEDAGEDKPDKDTKDTKDDSTNSDR